MLEYRYVFDEAFVIESVKKYRQQLGSKPWRVGVKVLCFIPMAALFLLAAFHAVRVPTLFFGVVLVALVFSPKLDFWLIKKRVRKSPHFHCEMGVHVTRDNYQESSKFSNSTIDWPVFTKVVRFDDGFLLFSGKHNFFWLPDAALVHHNIDEAQALFQEKIPNYKKI